MISFVILHYKNLTDTIECIESINKLDSEKSIIVVDNNSTTKLEQKKILSYTNDLVLLNNNLGFAKGNNAGCKYAIEKYHPDFLCVINSDTIINQKDFMNQIYNLYDRYNFDILGPKILPEKLESCNPFKVYKTLDEVQSRIEYTKKLIRIYKNPILRSILNIYIKIKRIFIKPVNNKNGDIDTIDVALHGCALIFSKKYYEKFKDVFYSETFLFHEEEFLYLRCKQNNLISLYSPKISIYHKEGQSVKKEFNKNKYQALIFRNEEILKSLTLLKQQMKG